MRMRRKPWARPELTACPFFIDEPEKLKNSWLIAYPKTQPFYLELGCGKGGFISQIAPDNLNINFLAIDVKSEMLGLAKRKVENAYKEKNLATENILLTAINIEIINSIISETDKVDRIYINFCNPWPKGKHHKRRLTHPRQLEKYKTFLRDGGEIHFKTDDDELFEHSLIYFKESGFEITYLTKDLHNSDYTHNYVTEHENMFSEMGIKIKFLIAKKL